MTLSGSHYTPEDIPTGTYGSQQLHQGQAENPILEPEAADQLTS